MAKPPNTRKAIESKLEGLLGSGEELLPSEVPTLRSALRYAIHLQKDYLIREEGGQEELLNIQADGRYC